MDNAGEQVGPDTDMQANIRKYDIRTRLIEPQRYNHNK